MSREEIAALNTRLAEMQSKLDDLEARPRSPHADAIAEFDADHRRRVEAGRKVIAEQQAAEEHKLAADPRTFVRARNITRGTLPFKVTVTEHGPSQFVPNTAPRDPKMLAPSGEWKSTRHEVTRVTSIARDGYEIAETREWAQLVAKSPDLARLIANGSIVVEPFTDAENRDHKLRLLRAAEGAPLILGR